MTRRWFLKLTSSLAVVAAVHFDAIVSRSVKPLRAWLVGGPAHGRSIDAVGRPVLHMPTLTGAGHDSRPLFSVCEYRKTGAMLHVEAEPHEVLSFVGYDWP